MPRLKLDAKRAQLIEQKAKLEAQLRTLDAKKKLTERKEDTRRKVIAGALALEHMEQNPNDPFAVAMRELLTHFVEPRARHLFPFLKAFATVSETSTETGSQDSQVAA
jgi:large subunit ribosomal protein L7/L12